MHLEDARHETKKKMNENYGKLCANEETKLKDKQRHTHTHIHASHHIMNTAFNRLKHV